MRENPAPDDKPKQWRLAVHERLLPGDTAAQRVKAAAEAGFAGIEYDADGLAARVPDIVAALRDAPVVAAAVHMGFHLDFLSQSEPTRQRALDALRFALTDAQDIDAETVAVVPQPGPVLDLPDLMPFKSPEQIAAELMIWHLRGYSDLAYVFGRVLALHPVNRYESAFLNRLAQGVELRRRLKFNKYVWLAADCYHMAHEEAAPLDALAEHADSINHVYLAEASGALPGIGNIDFAAVLGALPARAGWAVVRGYGIPAPPKARQLAACAAHLTEIGFEGT